MIDLFCYINNERKTVYFYFEVYKLKRLDSGELFWCYQTCHSKLDELLKRFPGIFHLPRLVERTPIKGFSHSRPFFEEDLRYD